ncbi:MAG: outer membrane protein assembly factor BamD [Acidobacteriota bacterium]
MRTLKALAAVALTAAFLSTACTHRRPKDVPDQEVVPVSVLYEKGQAAIKKKKPGTARKYFDQITLREDAGEYKDKAAIATADAFMIDHTMESYAEAISRYQSFLAFHPTHPDAPYCQFRIGEAYLESVETPDRDMTPARSARDSFQAVVDNYPKSAQAEPARQKLAAINDLLAAHEIKVGDFYLKNEHPKGAIARYRGVIEKYPKYWNLPVVYYRLGDALAMDGQTQEATLYYQRIVETVPGTVLAKDAQKRLSQVQRKEERSLRKQRKDVFEEPLLPKKKTKHWWQFWK